jgi:long-chain acyl-CoA synthetase
MLGITAPYSTVYEALAAAAAPRPGKVALIKDDVCVTYAELLERIDNTARHLRALGIGRGEAFALYGQNTLEHYFCYYAAAKIGAIFVPVNPNLTASEVAYTFAHSDAKVLFHDTQVVDAAREAVPASRLLPVEMLRTIASGEDHAAAMVNSEADFIIIYSSGTTGVPKAVALDHRSQVAAANSLAQMWGITENDVTLIGLPLGYLYGISTSSASNLHVGGTVVVLRRFHPREVLEGFGTYGVTVYQGVPTMYSMMMEYCDERRLSFDLSALRLLICSGAPLPDETAARFTAKFGKALENYYGLTEVYPVFAHYHDEAHPAPKGAVGKPAPGVTVRIQRPDGSECAIGEAGEALVRGPATMRRYHKAPELTADVLTPDGLFRTGDLVSSDADGWYYIVGRIKEIIIRGGHNISPAEVERILVSHPAVNQAAVVGIADRIFGECPVAFVVLRHGETATPSELEAHCEKLLSDFKVPRIIHIVAELPLGKTGKVDKKLLKSRAEGAAQALVS